jgi:hypothetical protein
VEKVPTFSFYQDGKVIRRIIENPKSGLIEDIMDIVFKSAPGSAGTWSPR